jgi:hypothetical protein
MLDEGLNQESEQAEGELAQMDDDQAQPGQLGQPEDQPKMDRPQMDQPTMDQPQMDQPQMDQQAQMQPKEKLQYFTKWSQNVQPGQSVHSYASTGFVLLSNSFNTLSQQIQQQGGQKIGQQAQQLQQTAKKLQDNQNIYEHPKQFQKGAQTTVSILESIQQQPQFSGMKSQVKKVQKSAEKIDPKTPLATQKDSIKSFFAQSATVINRMSQEVEKSAVGGGPDQPGQQKMKQDPMQQDKLQQDKMQQDQMKKDQQLKEQQEEQGMDDY